MAQTPEDKIKKHITDYIDVLEKKGCPITWERRDASGLGYRKGRCDLFVVYNGLHIEVEVKTKTGLLSSMQETWQRYCQAHSINHIVVRSREEFAKELGKITSS